MKVGVLYLSLTLSLSLLWGCSPDRGEGMLLKEGVKAPDFTLPDLEGREIGLQKDMAGRDTLIVFWATWCPSCEEELKILDKAYREYGEKGFNLLTINVYDDPDMVRRYVERRDLSFPVLLDTEGKVAERYQVYAIPIGYLLDGDGRIRKRFVGGIPEEEVSRLISEYLGG